MKTYEVELDMSFRRSVRIDADDEDEAVERACDEARQRYQIGGKYDVEVYGVREVKRQEVEG